MSSKKFEKYRRLLEALDARVGSDANAMADRTRAGSGGNSGPELSNAPLHLGDMGTEEYLYDMNATLLENEQYIVAEAQQALQRLENGTFGKCEACGRDISPARLEAIPYTRYCVECAAKFDETPEVNLNKGRPHTPADTLAPEGEMEEDRVRPSDKLDFAPAQLLHGDTHAAGTAGGGTAVGGLAGSNEGNGDPVIIEIDEATATGNFDIEDDRLDDRTPLSGFTGGAVGGTPARKRAK